MNSFAQGEGSGGSSLRPGKRRRGRPRKDPCLKNKEAAGAAPPLFEGMTKNFPREADSTEGGESVVGQAVAGFVEASFDAGYLLTVRIGNSATNLRGVVFKPGHFVPITAENDVAPHLQMIRRNDIHSPSENRSWSRRPKLAIKTASQKSKYSSPQTATSTPPVDTRGNLVPVVLQPINLPSVSPSSSQMPSDASRNTPLLTFGDKDVHMSEPQSIVPPDLAIPVSPIFIGAQLHSNHQVPQENVQNAQKLFSEGTSGFVQGEKVEPMESTDADNLASSESSDTETEDGKEEMKSSAEEEDSGRLVTKQETGNKNELFTKDPLQTSSVMNFSTTPLQPFPVANPLFSYGTGRMTELLQAVQENIKEKQVQISEQQTPSTSNVGFGETGASATDPNN